MVEALVAIVIIGIALLALLQVRNQTVMRFLDSGDQYTASWLAQMKMAELVSQNLPDPEDIDTWDDHGAGDFGEFDQRVNELNSQVNEDWVERRTFSKFEYEWTKTMILVGPELTGTREAFEDWEPEVDSSVAENTEDNPAEQLAARIVRVTLTVMIPMRRGRDGEGEVESDAQLDKRRRIVLVTYVDPSILFDAGEEEDPDGTDPENGR